MNFEPRFIIDAIYSEKHQKHWYHIGQVMLPVYKQFYKDIRPYKMRFSYSDWPHDYFMFENTNDETVFMGLYAEFVQNDDDDSNLDWVEKYCQPVEPVDTNSIEYEMMQILKEEIQKEIDLEIISEISKPKSLIPLGKNYIWTGPQDSK